MDEKQVHMNDDVVGFIDPDHPQRKYYKCRYCGNPFWKPDAFRKKYCSIECQKKSHSASRPKKIKAPKQPITKICEWCGDEFNAKNNKQKYCCKECGYEGNKRLQRQQWAKDYISKKVKCKECGVEFMTECGNKHSVFCCQTFIMGENLMKIISVMSALGIPSIFAMTAWCIKSCLHSGIPEVKEDEE